MLQGSKFKETSGIKLSPDKQTERDESTGIKTTEINKFFLEPVDCRVQTKTSIFITNAKGKTHVNRLRQQESLPYRVELKPFQTTTN